MTAHEYLSQVYVLDRKIKYDLRELENLREMSCSISSPNLGERVSGGGSQEAPFVKALERIWEKEDKINEEIKRLETLKEEINSTVMALKNADHRFVLLYRYLQNMTWYELSLEMNISVSTAKRWTKDALSSIKVPS